MADMTNTADIPDLPGESATTYEAEAQDAAISDISLVSDIPVEDTEKPIISDLPQEVTQSYGTGVHAEPGANLGRAPSTQNAMDEYNGFTPELTGGDVDAAWARADVGDETVGGTADTPDQDIVEELGAAVGIEMDDRSFLRTDDMLQERDSRRWELDPTSSEDYPERRRDENMIADSDRVVQE